MRNDQVGFGILGTGIMGRTYAEALRTQVQGGRLVAVALGTRGPKLAGDYSVGFEQSAEALVGRSDIDVVIIATPHSTHLPLALIAAEAYKHLYLEKPMARNVDECDQILNACRSHGVKVSVASQTRYYEITDQVKKEIRKGSIGDVRMLRILNSAVGWDAPSDNWTVDPNEGGAYLDSGVHACDSMRNFTQSEPTLTFARFHNFGHIAVPDPTAFVYYEFENGAACHLLMSYEIPPPGLGASYQFLIVGSDGILQFDRDNLLVGKGDTWQTVMQLEGWNWLTDEGKKHPRRIAANGRQLDEFINEVRGGRTTTASGIDGRAAVEMVQAAIRSNETNAPVTLPLLEG